VSNHNGDWGGLDRVIGGVALLLIIIAVLLYAADHHGG
jgi:hypothetical protein